MASWKDVRARSGLDKDRVSRAEEQMMAEVEAYRLAQLRADLGLTQNDVAVSMHASQPRVSQIERGDIDKTEVSTLRSYVDALGGRLEIVARVGNHRHVIG